MSPLFRRYSSVLDNGSHSIKDHRESRTRTQPDALYVDIRGYFGTTYSYCISQNCFRFTVLCLTYWNCLLELENTRLNRSCWGGMPRWTALIVVQKYIRTVVYISHCIYSYLHQASVFQWSRNLWADRPVSPCSMVCNLYRRTYCSFLLVPNLFCHSKCQVPTICWHIFYCTTYVNPHTFP